MLLYDTVAMTSTAYYYHFTRPSVAAFLFVREKSSKPADAIKLCKVGGADFAIGNDNQESGIFFGPDALVIPLVAKPYG